MSRGLKPVPSVGVARIRVARPRELGAAELTSWRAAQAADPLLQSPFLAPEFALAVEAARGDARIAAIEGEGGERAFLAYQQTALRAGVPIGASVCDRQAVVGGGELRLEGPQLLRGLGLTSLEFDHLLASQGALQAFHRSIAMTHLLDLREGFQGYWRRMGPAHRTVRDTWRKQSRLDRAHGPLTFELSSRDPEDLARLMRWKSDQFHRSGWPDRFAQKWVRELVTRLVQEPAPGCAGTLSVLRAGAEPVAYLLSLASPTLLSTWFPAYDPSFARFSPGMVLHLRVAEAAAAAGISWIDLGEGSEPYKLSLETDQMALAEALVARRAPSAWLRQVAKAPRRYLWGYVRRHEGLERPARALVRLAYGGRRQW